MNKFCLDIKPTFKIYDNAVVCYATAEPTEKTFKILHNSVYFNDIKLRKRQFKGVARLKEGDECNVEIGKKIAYLKCKRQINKAWANAIFGVAQEAIGNYNNIIDCYIEANDWAYDIDKEICDFIKE